MPDVSEADRLIAMLETAAEQKALERYKKGPNKPLFDADDLRTRLRQYDRTPFLSLLQQFITQGPTDEAIARMAEKWPEKWVMALVQLAKIGGFTEKTESNVNINVSIGQMSDSQLEADIKRELAELNIIDADFVEMEKALADGMSDPTSLSSDTSSDGRQAAPAVEQQQKVD